MEKRRLSNMTDRELRILKRELKHRIYKRRRIVVSSIAILFTVCMVFTGMLTFDAFHSNANDGFKYYTSITVEAGDTIWSIADDYIDYDHYKTKASYVNEILHINHIEDDSILIAGCDIIVPYYSLEYIK